MVDVDPVGELAQQLFDDGAVAGGDDVADGVADGFQDGSRWSLMIGLDALVRASWVRWSATEGDGRLQAKYGADQG